MSAVLLRWAVLFLLVALLSAALALSGLPSDIDEIFRISFFVFLVAFIVVAAASSVWR